MSANQELTAHAASAVLFGHLPDMANLKSLKASVAMNQLMSLITNLESFMDNDLLANETFVVMYARKVRRLACMHACLQV